MNTRKILSIILVLITIIASMCMFPNTSNAATYIIEEADLYSKGELVCFKHGETLIGVQFVVYKKDGVEYPAYCLDRTLPGVTEKDEYTVSADTLVTNNKVWRAVTNGYPFKTPKQLGVNSEIEAFAATKMAVYDALYNYDWDDFSGINAQGNRVVAAAEKISKAARASSATKPVSVVTLRTDDTKWEMDDLNNEYAKQNILCYNKCG